MSPPALTINDLTVEYGPVRALSNITLEVPTGSVVAVLGGNGAGKSTLLRAVSGVLPYHGGTVRGGEICLDGVPVHGRRPDQIVGLGVVQVPEGRRVFSRMTVADNLRAGALRGHSRKHRREAADAHAWITELFPVLAERAGQRAGLLSGGEQQMLAMGRALMARPQVLLLDEPSLGLAPIMVERIAATIQRINGHGTSILLIEQNAALALELSRHAYVLEVGEVALSGSSAELAASDEVRRRYLGVATDEDDRLDGEAAAGGVRPGRTVPTLERWAG